MTAVKNQKTKTKKTTKQQNTQRKTTQIEIETEHDSCISSRVFEVYFRK